MESLHIVEINLSGQFSSFADVISSLIPLKNLRKLTVGCQFKTYENLPDSLSLSVTELVLCGWGILRSWMETVVFYSILSFTPRLQELSVDICDHESHQKEIVKRLKNTELTKTLKVLNWSGELYEDDFYDLQNLSLEKFILRPFNQVNIEKLEIFLNNQNNVKAFVLKLTNLRTLLHGYPSATRIFALKNLQFLSLDIRPIDDQDLGD